MKLLLALFTLFLSPDVITAQTQAPFITQIRDLVIGAGASYTVAELYKQQDCGILGCSSDEEEWQLLASRNTDVDGRRTDLVTPEQFPIGNYKLVFKTGDYYAAKNVSTLYPYIDIVFQRSTLDQILIVVSLSPYGYSYYKGVNTFK